MKFKKLLFYLFFFVSCLSFGQGVSLLPTHLPKNIIGTWVNSNNEIILIVSEDYIVIQNKLYNYNNIILDNNRLDITCIINNDEVKYISLNEINSTNIQIDEGYRIEKLNKLNSTNDHCLNKNLIDNWYNSKNKITLKENEVQFSDEIYKIDFITSSNNTNTHIILYYEGDYFLMYNEQNENGNFLHANFKKKRIFKKATFYQKHKLKIWISLLILLFLLSGVILKNKIKNTRKKEITKRLILEMQLKSIRSQMNPHFLFNALSAIQNLINKGDNEQANHYLTEFSQLMRLTLDKSEKGVVPLFDEIESIKKYLELEKLRFSFNYEIIVGKKLNPYNTEIPAMLIQPIVENAILHGLNTKKEDKNLTIEFKIDQETLQCLVTDNGIGINVTKSKTKPDLNSQKYGLKLAKDRIKLINESCHTNAKISIRDLSDLDSEKTGTQVKISMPLKY